MKNQTKPNSKQVQKAIEAVTKVANARENSAISKSQVEKKITSSAKATTAGKNQKSKVVYEVKKPSANVKLANKLVESKNTMPDSSISKVSKELIFKASLLLGALLLAGVLYFNKGQIVVAVVNGQPIFRHQLMLEMERTIGRQTLDNMITRILIMQAGQKEKVQITEEELDTAYKKLEENFSSQGQDFTTMISAQGYTVKEVRDQLRLQIIVEKLNSGSLTITDEEVKTYMEENKQFLPTTTDSASLEAMVREQLKNQKLSRATQTWLDALYKESKVSHWLFKEQPSALPTVSQ